MENKSPPKRETVRSKPHSQSEQRGYCEQWFSLNGRMTRSAFCQKIGISTSTFSNWLSDYKKQHKKPLGFTPISRTSTVEQASVDRLQLLFPNGVKMSLSYREEGTFHEWIKGLIQCV